MSIRIYGIIQEAQKANLAKSIDFLEGYSGEYDMDSSTNCLLCILKRHFRFNLDFDLPFDQEGFSEYTGIPPARVEEIFCCVPSIAREVYRTERHNVTKAQVIVELKEEYKEIYGEFYKSPKQKDKEFSKKDLKSGMVVVENNRGHYQVIGDYLVNHLSGNVQRLELMEEDMTFSNSLCNVSKVFEPTQRHHYNPEYYQHKGLNDFKKVYDRSEIEEKERQEKAKEDRKRLLVESMEELEGKLKMVREDFEKEFGDGRI